MHAAQKPKSMLKFVTLDKESNMSTLWRREEFLSICSKEELAEKAQNIEVTIYVRNILESFKRTTHRDEGFLEEEDAEANEHTD